MKTFMKKINIRPSDPTVRVYINGLGLLCFSAQFRRAEVGFLNVQEHPLLFTIFDRRCKPVHGTPIELTSGTGIKINSEHLGLGSLYCSDNGGTESLPDDDFRHIIDINELHASGFGAGRVKVKANPYFAKLYLYNGVFFTAELSKQTAKILDISRPIKKDKRIGKVIGADIKNDSVRIDISSLNAPIFLKRDSSSAPYSIEIRYKCEDVASEYTDFRRFYEVLELPAGHRPLDLKYDAIELPERKTCEKKLLDDWEKSESFRKKADENPAMLKLIQNLFLAREACEGAAVPEWPQNLEGIPETDPS